jgi:two-component system sensor histidine kinase MprB
VSLRVRMGLAAGVAVALAVIAVAVSAYAGTRSQLQGQIDNSLHNLTQQLLVRAGVAGGPPGPPGATLRNNTDAHGGDRDEGLGLDHLPPSAFGGAEGTFTVVHPDGSTYPAPGQRRIPADSRAKALAASGRGQYFTDMTVGGTHIRVLFTGIGGRGALAAALPLSEVDHTLRNELLLLVLIAAGGIALAGVLGILVARTALAPIERFTRQTESIADNPDRLEHERLEVIGRDELARLARTFNNTLDALEGSVQSQRNLVADASHELRTPIATIRANLQLMRDEARLSEADRDALRADVIEELDELTALVADIVDLARGSKPGGELEEVRLDRIVAEVVERTRRRGPDLTVRATLEPTLVHGDGDRVARAVSNVLDNARKWSPPDGVVEVDLRDATLTVRDHGPGFRDEDLPFVFDRFHRARDARSKPGSGLGLAILRQTAQAHGGFAQAANAPDGGAIVRVGFGPGEPPDELPDDSDAASRQTLTSGSRRPR